MEDILTLLCRQDPFGCDPHAPNFLVLQAFWREILEVFLAIKNEISQGLDGEQELENAVEIAGITDIAEPNRP